MIPKFTAKIHDVSTSSHVDASGFLCLSEPWWRQPHLYILQQNWNSNIDWLVQRTQVSEPDQGNQDDVPSASGCGGSSERQVDVAASVCMLPAGAGFLTAALLQKGILSPRNCEWLVVPSAFVWDAGKARQLLWVQGATCASEQRVLSELHGLLQNPGATGFASMLRSYISAPIQQVKPFVLSACMSHTFPLIELSVHWSLWSNKEKWCFVFVNI